MFDRSDHILSRLRAPLRVAGGMLVLWLALQALVYRTGAYYFVAEPESNTGVVMNALLMLEQQYQPGARTVVVFGDSRVAEGFSGALAQSGGSIHFIALGVSGSTPRTWYYLMREIVRRNYRIDAFLVGVTYQPFHEALSNWPLSPIQDAPLLGLADTPNYLATFDAAPARERARRAVLFPAAAMRQDTWALLRAPLDRWHRILDFRPIYLAAVPLNPGREGSMPTLGFSGERNVLDWGSASAGQRSLIEAALAQRALPIESAVRAANADYFGRWLGAMADLARAHDSRAILFPLPRGPYHEVLGDAAAIPEEFHAAVAHPGIVALPADLVESLEQPSHFFDMLHVNRAGREQLSAQVGLQVRTLLDPAAP